MLVKATQKTPQGHAFKAKPPQDRQRMQGNYPPRRLYHRGLL